MIYIVIAVLATTNITRINLRSSMDTMHTIISCTVPDVPDVPDGLSLIPTARELRESIVTEAFIASPSISQTVDNY